jgi:AraC-like DNA-binding protein
MLMSGDGTRRFRDPDDYQAAIEGATGATVKLVHTGGGDFKARLTWLSLPHLRVLLGRENLPRIAYVSLPPDRIVISVSSTVTPMNWGGRELRRGDIVFHSRGERAHQRTNGESQWGLVSLSSKHLSACSVALTGREVKPPPVARVLRPVRTAATRLLRLHSEVCRLAETRPPSIEHAQGARAFDQEFLHAVVNCLTADDACDHIGRRRRHAYIMVRFEEALTGHLSSQLQMPAFCEALGVSERTLRVCCAESLGISPMRYFVLRRLNLARSALRHAGPNTSSIAEIAQSLQFSQPGRFAVMYRAVFGEMPSTTLRARHGQIGVKLLS